MTQISATDQILLLLREQLRRSERGRVRGIEHEQRKSATPQQRIEALAAIRDLPERDFRRALVRGLLGERLGEELVAEPAFEAVTGEVLRLIEASPEAQQLLDRVARDFRPT
jgi:hypothetical protein